MRACASPTSAQAALAASIGAGVLLTDADLMARFLRDWTGKHVGTAVAVALPTTTNEVAGIVRVAAAHGLAVVPQGGNSGLVGGSVPAAGSSAVVISLERMRRIRTVDPSTPAVVVEAGCVLADLNAALRRHSLMLPLGLGSEGTATIGGLVSTDAGGTRALRYGTMRRQVLGLEVVLADGRILEGARGILKDTTGYALAQLFAGSEGTLGIVTAAALRLSPAWKQVETAWVGVVDPAAALALLATLRDHCGEIVVACELAPALGVEWACQANATIRAPLAPHIPWLVLVELATSASHCDLGPVAEGAIAAAIEKGIAIDAVIAQSDAQRAAFWAVREALVDGKRQHAPLANLDLVVPVGAVPEFIERAGEIVGTVLPEATTLAFGHVGDGNVHYSIHAQPGARRDAAAAAVDDLALALGGAICAEHGVGRVRRREAYNALGPTAAETNLALKRALDPGNLLNPGVATPDQGSGA